MQQGTLLYLHRPPNGPYKAALSVPLTLAKEKIARQDLFMVLIDLFFFIEL